MLKYLNRTMEIDGQSLPVHASAGVIHAAGGVTAFVHSWPSEAAFVAGEQPAAKWSLVVELPFDDEQPEQALSDAPGGPLHGAHVVSVQWPPVDLADLKAAKNAAITARRVQEDQRFQFGGKWFQADHAAWKQISGVHGWVSAQNTMPPGWIGQWKAEDNTTLPIPDPATWWQFYGAVLARGSSNFMRGEALKAQIAAATTPEQLAAVPDW